MNPAQDLLERECRTFTLLLTKLPANAYVLQKYVEAHRALDALAEQDRFDTWMVRRAAAGPILARIADAYARRFAPQAVLRRKLILVLALLETAPPYHREMDGSSARSVLGIVMSLMLSGLHGVVVTVLGIVLCGPFHLLLRERSR